MAKRKPAGIVDDIVGGIRDIVSPWLGTPPGEARQVTQGKALARGAAETLDQTFAGGMIKAGVQGNKALAKQAAVNAAALGTGYVAGKVVQTAVKTVAPSIARVLAKTNLSSELAPGQSLALHFSNNPNLKTIKDIQKLRNKGANFGSDFDSTKISYPGSTYGYGPIDKSSSFNEVQGAIQEADISRIRALIQGEKRNYTLYATNANPLKNSGGRRVKDPEYGSSVLAGDQGQSVFGKQRVIAKIPLNFDAVTAARAEELRLGKLASPTRSNPEYEAAQQKAVQIQQQMTDSVYNALVGNKNVLRAGISQHSLQNPSSAYYYGTPAIPRIKTTTVPSVTEIIKNMAKDIPKITAVASVAASKKIKRR